MGISPGSCKPVVIKQFNEIKQYTFTHSVFEVVQHTFHETMEYCIQGILSIQLDSIATKPNEPLADTYPVRMNLHETLLIKI